MSGHGNRHISGLRFSLGGAPFLAATWVPEGIVLTPRTAAAPHGYGFPKRHATTGAKIDPPFGTLIEDEEDEALNQVLINRFENNKYLDRLGFVSGIPNKNGKSIFELPETNDRLRDSLAVELTAKPFAVVYWPLWYEPKEVDDAFWSLSENRINWTDVPGVNRWSGGYNFKTLPKPPTEDGELTGDLPSRQFDDDGEPLIFEPESEEWFCHWPEELLYDNDAFEAIFQETNRYRAEVGREPLHRELRGYANTGRMILSEMQRAEVMFHNDEERYRSGYGTVFYRASNGGHTLFGGGENLLAGVSGFSWDSGVAAALGWRNSPLHYANMISTSWKTRHTSLDVSGNISVTLTEKGSVAGESSILDQEFDPPFAGRAWSQLFLQKERWLYAGTCEFRTVHGSVTTDSFASPMGKPFTIKQAGGPFIYYRGQAFFVEPLNDRMDEVGATWILGASLYVNNGVLSFLVIFGYYDTELAKRFINYTTRSVAIHGEWVIGTPFELDANLIGFTQCFQFYAAGESGFITMAYLDDSIKYATYFTDYPANKSLDMAPGALRLVLFDIDNGFSVSGDLIRPSNISYGITVSPYTIIPGGKTGLDVRHFGESVDGGDPLYPFINKDFELDYIKREWLIDLDRRWTSGTEIIYNFTVLDELVFPSGQRITLRDWSIAYSGATSNEILMELAEGAKSSFLFYINPVSEDCLVGRISFRDNGTRPIAFMLGDLDVVYKDQVIKSYETAALHRLDDRPFLSPGGATVELSGVIGDWVGGANWAGFGFNSLSPEPSYDVVFTPIPSRYVDTNHWFCPSDPSLFFYPQKAVFGTYPGSISYVNGTSSGCFLDKNESVINYGYEFGLPVVSLFATGESVLGLLAGYKEKVVSQFTVYSLFGIHNTTGLGRLTPSAATRRGIYSDIEGFEEMMSGETLTNIMPFGVIS